MATYKKGWTPEEKKVINTSKKTIKTVFESVTSSMFPFDNISFDNIKETFMYRYIRNFIGGLLIIGFLLLILYLGAIFVTWSVPKGNDNPIDGPTKMFFRLIFLGYLFVILCWTIEED